MKKSLILLPSLLFIIFFIFSAIDPSDYVVEKKMWKIKQQFAALTLYSGALSKAESENLATMYQNLIRQYPESSQLPQIYMQIGQLYAGSNDFKEARMNYLKVLQYIPRQKYLCSSALMGIGLTYEKEKKDVQALTAYQQIVKNYPITHVGLSLPLYIANYYHRLGKDAEAQHAFKEAEGFYQKIVQENPDSLDGFNALRFLATTYLVQKKWDDVINTLGKTLLDYSRSPYLDWKTARAMIYSMTVVSIEELKRPNQAIIFYQMFIEKNPGHPLNKFLKKVIVSLQGLKNENKALVIQKI